MPADSSGTSVLSLWCWVVPIETSFGQLLRGGALEELSAAGHDVLWIGRLPQDPGDEEVLRQAFQDKRILVTLDKDFGELSVVRGMAHSGILRLVNISARQQAKICLHILEHYGQELQAGALVTAEADRLRIRPPQDWRSSS